MHVHQQAIFVPAYAAKEGCSRGTGIARYVVECGISAAEAAWRIERDQAHTEQRKPPLKPPRVWRVQGV